MIICDICGGGGMMNNVILGWPAKIVSPSDMRDDRPYRQTGNVEGAQYHICEVCSKKVHKVIETMKIEEKKDEVKQKND